jgi:hypothetical protein
MVSRDRIIVLLFAALCSNGANLGEDLFQGSVSTDKHHSRDSLFPPTRTPEMPECEEARSHSLALSYIFRVPVMPQRRLTPRTSRATSLHPCYLLFPFIVMDTVSLVYSALSPSPRNLFVALEPYPRLGIHSCGEQFLRLFQFTSLLSRGQVTW